MLTQLYSIFDKKTGIYQTPFAAPTREAAFRIIQAIVNCKEPDLQCYYQSNPEDFSVYSCGTFEDEHCLFDTHHPEFLCDFMAFVQYEEPSSCAQ